MKIVRGKALKMIAALVDTTATVTEILDDLAVPRSTFYGRWRKDPVFLDALAEARQDFEISLRGKYVSKRRRIEELSRLYDATPDSGEEYWHNGSVKRIHSNASVKASILRQIQEELEGFEITIGQAGNKVDQGIQEQRRKAAADLEVFEAAEREAAKSDPELQAAD